MYIIYIFSYLYRILHLIEETIFDWLHTKKSNSNSSILLSKEITLDVFLQVSWEDKRLNVPPGRQHIDLPWDYRQLIWTPDLYIWQLQTMRILSVLQEMASLRLYENGTVSVNIGLVFCFHVFLINERHKLNKSF